MSLDLARLLELNRKVDGETAKLFARFVMRAIESGDANTYVKERLRRVLSEDDTEVVDSNVGPKAE